MPTSKTKKTTAKSTKKTANKSTKSKSAVKSAAKKFAKTTSKKSTTKKSTVTAAKKSTVKKSTLTAVKKSTVKKSQGNNKTAKKSSDKNTNITMTKKRKALIAGIKAKLEQQRFNLLQGLQKKGSETEVSSHGDLIDQSQNFSEHEVMLGLAEHDRNLLQKINAALDKIDQGKYGICEMSGELISDERLLAMPTARYSMECQAKIEGYG